MNKLSSKYLALKQLLYTPENALSKKFFFIFVRIYMKKSRIVVFLCPNNCLDDIIYYIALIVKMITTISKPFLFALNKIIMPKIY